MIFTLQVRDNDCDEDELHTHTFPADTDLQEMLIVVRLLYPTATEIHIYLEEDKSEE
jgi:hypothetical protein